LRDHPALALYASARAIRQSHSSEGVKFLLVRACYRRHRLVLAVSSERCWAA
jgi:hypothetical protein